MPKKKTAAPPAMPTPDGKPIALSDDQEFFGYMPAGRDIAVVTKSKFRDEVAVDIRRYYDAGEAWRPSPKGVRLPMGDKQALLDLLAVAEEAAAS